MSRKNVAVALVCLVALAGVARANWTRTFEGPLYAGIPEGSSIDGTDGWWSSTGPNRILDDAYSKPGRAVQFYPGTGAHFILRWMNAPEKNFYPVYQFTGLRSNSANNIRMGISATNQQGSGQRFEFGIEGTDLVAYSDGQPEVRLTNVVPDDGVWYDVRATLDDVTDTLFLSYKETTSSTWTVRDDVTTGLPSSWYGDLQMPNQVWVQADGSDGPFVDDLRMMPEPGTMALLALGGLALLRRRRG